MIQNKENMTRWLGGVLGPGPWMQAALLMAQADDAETVLVTGANRALGQEFARQHAADGWTVRATRRDDSHGAALLDELDYRLGETILRTNTLGPLWVAESFARQIGSSQQKRIVSISSTRGSWSRSMAGIGAVLYRASKGAMNRALLAVTDQERPQGITVRLIHAAEAGQYGRRPKLDVTVRKISKTMGDVTIKDSGRFLLYDGSTLPW